MDLYLAVFVNAGANAHDQFQVAYASREELIFLPQYVFWYCESLGDHFSKCIKKGPSIECAGCFQAWPKENKE